MSNKNLAAFKTFTLVIQLGLIMIFAILIGTVVGWMIGKSFGCKNMLTIIGMITGIVAGFYNAYKQIMK